MIAFIQGELCDAGQDTIVVACHGIGYEIQIPVSVAQALPDPGNVVKIYTYTYVKLFVLLIKKNIQFSQRYGFTPSLRVFVLSHCASVMNHIANVKSLRDTGFAKS